MAIYSCTLIYRYKTDKSDSELLKLLKLERKKTHYIKAENTPYNETLSSSYDGGIFVTSKDDFVIIVGMPLVTDFLHTNYYYGVFLEAEFFFTFYESTSMLTGFVWGKGEKIYRKKYIQNGKYIKAYDCEPDQGDLLNVEKLYYNLENLKIKNSEDYKNYINGIYDFEISMKFVKIHFGIEPINFLENLIFNKNLSLEWPNYHNEVNEKITEKDIDSLFINKFVELSKKAHMKKINFKGIKEQVPKFSYYKQFENYKICVVSKKIASFTPFVFYFSILSDNPIISKFVGANDYGIPLFSYSYLNYKNELNKHGVYVKADLDLLENKLVEDLNILEKILSIFSLKNGLELFYKDSEIYRYCFNKIANFLKVKETIGYVNEINFCMIHILLTNDSKKIPEFILLLKKDINFKRPDIPKYLSIPINIFEDYN